MSKNKIPNELRLDLTDDGQGQSQWVETRLILPVSGSDQKQVRFLLPKEGIMEKSAFISFQVIGSNEHQRLPLWSGAMSAFNTATLYCGGVQVCQSRGINSLWTLKNFYRDPHDRNNKQAKRAGAFTALMVDTSTTAPGSGSAVNPALTQVAHLGLTNSPGMWGADVYQDFFAVTDPLTDQARHVTEGYYITDSEDTSPEWVIYLTELFPLLYQESLPLGLLQDNFSIVLDLQQEQTRGDRTVGSAGGGWVKGTEYINFKLHVDLVFYDDPINTETTMDKLQKKFNAGLSLPFTDYTYVLQNQAAEAIATNNQKVATLLGLNLQVVRRLFVATPEAANYGSPATSGNPTLGNYHSLGSNLKNSMQITVNAQPYYPAPVDSDGRLQNQLSQCFPTSHKINQALQSFVGQVNEETIAPAPPIAAINIGEPMVLKSRITDKTLEGQKQNVQMGCGHYYGINLSKSYSNQLGQGTAVGRSPVILELEDQRADSTNGNKAKLVHIWAECERVLRMQNGKILVSGA